MDLCHACNNICVCSAQSPDKLRVVRSVVLFFRSFWDSLHLSNKPMVLTLPMNCVLFGDLLPWSCIQKKTSNTWRVVRTSGEPKGSTLEASVDPFCVLSTCVGKKGETMSVNNFYGTYEHQIAAWAPTRFCLPSTATACGISIVIEQAAPPSSSNSGLKGAKYTRPS